MLRLGMCRRRNQVAAFGLVVGLSVAGCGGGHGSALTGARLPHALGVRLEGEATAIHLSLTRGDGCAAARQASQLRGAVSVAVAAGQVPAALRAPLSNSVRSLATRIRCVSPPAKPAHPHKHGSEGDKQGNGNGNGNGDGGDGGGD
jgi:hypothetical protein